MRAVRAFSLARWRPDPLRLTAVLLPPLAVRNAGRRDLVPLNAFLTLLLWVPGVVHAMNVVSRTQWEREQQFVSAFRSHIGHLR